MFHYPVNSSDSPSVNWCITENDLLLIEEVSTIPKQIFHHIIRTFQDLPMNPVVLLCGDPQQQQPIPERNNYTEEIQSIINDRSFYCLVVRYLLTEQHCCTVPQYMGTLDCPTSAFLDVLQGDKMLVTGCEPTDDIYNTLVQFSAATFFTVSHNDYNRVAIKRLFSLGPLDTIQ